MNELQCFRHPDEVVYRKEEDGKLRILKINDDEDIFELDELLAEAWLAFENPKSPFEVRVALKEKYPDCEGIITQHCDKMMQELFDIKLLERA